MSHIIAGLRSTTKCPALGVSLDDKINLLNVTVTWDYFFNVKKSNICFWQQYFSPSSNIM